MEGIQISFFDEALTDEQVRLRENLKRGSGYEGGRLRIYAAEQLLDDQRFVEFLADEFNTGGHSIKGGFMDYNNRGVLIRDWKTGREWRYTWKQVAKEYRQMITNGEFPDPVDVVLYQAARAAGKGAPAPRMHYWGGED